MHVTYSFIFKITVVYDQNVKSVLECTQHIFILHLICKRSVQDAGTMTSKLEYRGKINIFPVIGHHLPVVKRFW